MDHILLLHIKDGVGQYTYCHKPECNCDHTPAGKQYRYNFQPRHLVSIVRQIPIFW